MLELDEADNILDQSDCLYSADFVAHALKELSNQIISDYSRKNPLVLCVMKGGIFTSYSLLQYFTFPLEIDYLQVSRYGSDTQGGELIWKVEPSEPLSGREVLIIDDILDEGVTINKIIEYCKEKGAKSVAAAVLVKKCHGRGTHNSLVRYVALEVPDRYIFGCGMDFKGYFRNLPAIYAINEP